MCRLFILIIAGLFMVAPAWAQTIGVTLDFGGIDQPWPTINSYAPLLPHNVRINNLPGGTTDAALANTATDVAYIASKTGWVIISGLLVDVIGQPIPNGGSVFRIFKNSQPGICNDGTGPPLASSYGIGPAWSNVIPITGMDYAQIGDSYSFCLYLAAGDSNNYISGNQAHSRISIVELP